MRVESHPGPGLAHLELAPEGVANPGTLPAVICLHGYGAEKNDLTGLARSLDDRGYRYYFPDAPSLAFDGTDRTSRAWYERGGNESPGSVAEAVAALDDFVQGVGARGAAPMALLGFSQGGAMAARYGLPRPERFAGVAILSGSLRRVDDLTPTLPLRRDQPVHVSHGVHDTVVPAEVSRALLRYLEAQGYRPEQRFYGAGHFITPAQLRDLRAWLHRVLPPG